MERMAGVLVFRSAAPGLFVSAAAGPNNHQCSFPSVVKQGEPHWIRLVDVVWTTNRPLRPYPNICVVKPRSRLPALTGRVWLDQQNFGQGPMAYHSLDIRPGQDGSEAFEIGKACDVYGSAVFRA